MRLHAVLRSSEVRLFFDLPKHHCRGHFVRCVQQPQSEDRHTLHYEFKIPVRYSPRATIANYR